MVPGSKYEFLVSACLAGVNCTYNATNNMVPSVRKLFRSGRCLLVCPEVMGGLTTPRPPAEIFDRKAGVVNFFGRDVTKECCRGVKKIERLAKFYGIRKAILKTKSPCCGKGYVYDGTFSGKLVKANGLLAAALIKNKVKVYTEKGLKISSPGCRMIPAYDKS